MKRTQHALLPAYSLTFWKCQGQNIALSIVDATTPTGNRNVLNVNAVYVGFSRSAGRDSIRLLRPLGDSYPGRSSKMCPNMCAWMMRGYVPSRGTPQYYSVLGVCFRPPVLPICMTQWNLHWRLGSSEMCRFRLPIYQPRPGVSQTMWCYLCPKGLVSNNLINLLLHSWHDV